jgi:predicted GIY-YIG superfamily endonuclease
MHPDSSYLVYLLHSTLNPRRTYIGCTNNMVRRLRQHNGELVGGARATHNGRPWRVAITVTGFHDQRQALQFEWAWKHMRHGGSGVDQRRTHLVRLMAKERWTSNAPLAASVSLHVNNHPNLIVA